MPRTARIVVPGMPHHVTQRGNQRQRVFFSPADYRAWLQIATGAFRDAKVEVLAYCLMPNHIHLIATPTNDTGLARAMAVVSATYARRIQARRDLPGHLWQGRYASFPMDETYLYRCVRYVGLNPVRAGLVSLASDWPWSSVRAHLGGVAEPLLTPAPVAELLDDDAAWAFGLTRKDDPIWTELRHATRYGSPRGSSDWVKGLQ